MAVHEQKSQKQQEDSEERSSISGADSNIPNQCEISKNTVNGEEKLQADNDHTYGFIDEYLEESINTSNVYKSTQETDYVIIFQNMMQMLLSVLIILVIISV
jgi:hypothetical protein